MEIALTFLASDFPLKTAHRKPRQSPITRGTQDHKEAKGKATKFFSRCHNTLSRFVVFHLQRRGSYMGNAAYKVLSLPGVLLVASICLGYGGRVLRTSSHLTSSCHASSGISTRGTACPWKNGTTENNSWGKLGTDI